jgi:hypothetical protein
VKIKYVFLKTDDDPQAIRDITLEQKCMPRIGELVDFNVRINDDEYVDRMGRVDDVTWHISNDKQDAVVFIS